MLMQNLSYLASQSNKSIAFVKKDDPLINKTINKRNFKTKNYQS